jgi:hypothetical protein
MSFWQAAEKPCADSNDPSGREYTDRAGAGELKSRIEGYWRERGFDIQVMLVEGAFTPALRAGRFDVRSELIDGLPRAARPPIATAND